jgi:hypothetical protein
MKSAHSFGPPCSDSSLVDRNFALWRRGHGGLEAGLDLPELGFRVTEHVASETATHVLIGRK